MNRIGILQRLYLAYFSWCRGYISDEKYADTVAALHIEWEFAEC